MAGETLRIALVLDATGAAAERHARALGGFLRDGLRLSPEHPADAVTHLFYAEECARERLLALAPTRHVRLVRAPPHRPDLMAAALAAFAAGGGADLFVFGGPLGAELAARLAARSGGGVLTGVLDAVATAGTLSCRRHVSSHHLIGRFELRARPRCVTLDAGWLDAGSEPPAEHVVQASVELREDASSAPRLCDDVEVFEPPATSDLEAAQFLVVAGRGAGGRGGVERIAAAAGRMGAAFGVTRPVVMNAWAAPDRQLGVSGTRAAPAVCIVAGSSGAPAFLWGVERAGFIVAVDTDEHSTMAGEADAVVLDDAVTVLEALADIVARERP
jgi:electron transfer flavoprotein alpha subunit